MKRIQVLAILLTIPGVLFVYGGRAAGYEPAGGGGFTIGGSVYTDINDPIGSGLPGVTILVQCTRGFGAEVATVANPAAGLWQVDGVPEDSCVVTPAWEGAPPGYCFLNVVRARRATNCEDGIGIVVNADNQQQNQSLQFLAVADCEPGVGPGACCLSDGSCQVLARSDCQAASGAYHADGLICGLDPDGDGIAGCDDVCPCAEAPGGVDVDGRPLGDLVGGRPGGKEACTAAPPDCDVDLCDHAVMQRNFSGPQ